MSRQGNARKPNCVRRGLLAAVIRTPIQVIAPRRRRLPRLGTIRTATGLRLVGKRLTR